MTIPKEIVETAKSIMLDFGNHPLTIFVIGTKGKIYFTVPHRETYPERVEQMIRSGMFAARQRDIGDLVQVIYISEGWAGAHREQFVRPSVDPNRREVLLITELDVAQNTQSVEAYICVRDRNDKVVELKPMLPEKQAEVSSELLPSFVLGFRLFKRSTSK